MILKLLLSCIPYERGVEFINYQHYIWAYNYKYKLRSIQKYREYGPWSCIICRMWKTYIYTDIYIGMQFDVHVHIVC